MHGKAKCQTLQVEPHIVNRMHGDVDALSNRVTKYKVCVS